MPRGRAGHRDLPVPPTFLGNSLELELPEPLGWLAELGGDLTKTTHAEQKFTYLALAYAGTAWCSDAGSSTSTRRRAAQLEFVVKRTDIMRGEAAAGRDRFHDRASPQGGQA